ncbi:MAG: hypothetical protein JSR29_20185 [Nitrospira sp.]|nr:hypothetical protein [Nitrospira sp.]
MSDLEFERDQSPYQWTGRDFSRHGWLIQLDDGLLVRLSTKSTSTISHLRSHDSSPSALQAVRRSTAFSDHLTRSRRLLADNCNKLKTVSKPTR